MTGMRLRTVPLLVMALAVGNGCRSGPERIDAAFEAASEAYTDAMASLGAASDLVEAARGPLAAAAAGGRAPAGSGGGVR